jgi:glycosyltransferase involved in cell wall biosynthesis
MAQLIPDADLYALTLEPTVELKLANRRVATTFLDTSLGRRHRALSLPIMPMAWHRLERDGYDLVITSSHAFSREFLRPSKDAIGLSYIHAPMRYAWNRDIDHRRQLPLSGLAARMLRRFDRASVSRFVGLAANSLETQRRINQCYQRDSTVIYPPVDTHRFRTAARMPQGYALAYGRFVAYKRFDLAIEASALSGIPLILAGAGPESANLKKLAHASSACVTFVEAPTDRELIELLSGAEMVVFPGHEDFGLIPVESMAAGVPVVACRHGGSVETVIHGETGLLATPGSASAIAQAMTCAILEPIDPARCRRGAERFSTEVFDASFLSWVSSHA